jgi:hypothetical protein
MKYLLAILMLATLTACQTATELQSASSKGLANIYSCGQINAAFAAYEADKTSFAALEQIAAMSGLVINKSTGTDASSYYESIKSAASVALLVQGCQPRA